MRAKRLFFLKVPDNLVQVANLNGKLKLVEFWYAVKLINREGVIFEKNFSEISRLIEIAEKTVYKNLLKLVKEGVAERKGISFKLCSYNRLWLYVGQ